MITEAPATSPGHAADPADRPRLALLALAHAVTDSYGSSFLAPIFPLLAARLGLSLAMVGSLPMVMGLSSSLGQPLLGYLTDRRSRFCLVALGPAVAALGCGMVGHMPGYAALLACLFVTGLGIGAFHPQGASLARHASGGSGLAMSAFTVGGNIGFGLAPLACALALRTLGLTHLHWIALPGLVLAVVIWQVFRRSGIHKDGQDRVSPSLNPVHPGNPVHPVNSGAPERLNARRSLAFLTATVAVRAAVQVGTATFLPFYLVTHALPGVGAEAARGLAVSVFLLANAFGGPVGGHLSDRMGRKRVMFWSFLFAVPPLTLAFHLSGYAGLAALAIGGSILMMPQPSNVIMAQELMPERAGTAASLITGLAWGVAMIFAMPLGALADRYGVGAVLRALALLPLFGAPLVLPIVDVRQRSAIGGQQSPTAAGTTRAPFGRKLKADR
jgi:FSR family fosmidomycin resistance protein-like MFS transporter